MISYWNGYFHITFHIMTLWILFKPQVFAGFLWHCSGLTNVRWRHTLTPKGREFCYGWVFQFSMWSPQMSQCWWPGHKLAMVKVLTFHYASSDTTLGSKGCCWVREEIQGSNVFFTNVTENKLMTAQQGWKAQLPTWPSWVWALGGASCYRLDGSLVPHTVCWHRGG